MAEIFGFVIVAVVALFIAWPLLERRTAAAADARLSDEMADLLSRRDTLYRELADLDFDHRLGKVDDEDYAQQREEYLDAAALVLLHLDSAPSSASNQPAPLTPEQQDEIEAEIRQLRGRGSGRVRSGGIASHGAAAAAPITPVLDSGDLCSAPAIRALGLTKAFGARLALRDLTFEIAPGERVAVLGPNGAGKSTLLRVLSLLLAPTAGTLEVGGYWADRDGNRIRAMLGAVLHESLLYADLTLIENLRFFARLYGQPERDACHGALLDRLDLARVADQRVKFLSRGQRQRASLARALVHQPSLLLLDEPDTGQDPRSLRRVEQELLAAAGRTIVFSTHHAEHALAVATRVFVLADGAGYDLGPAGALSYGALQAALTEAGA